MKNLEKNLGKDETIVEIASMSPVVLVPKALICILLFLFGVGSEEKSMPFIMLFIDFLIMVKPVVTFLTTKLYFTNKRLIGKIGLFNTKSLDTPLNKVNNVSVQQGIVDKTFGCGDIAISSSSASYKFQFIKNPESFRSKLMEQIDKFDEDRIKKQAMEMAKAMKEQQ